MSEEYGGEERRKTTFPGCPDHTEFTELMTKIATDIKWLIRIGAFWLVVVGGAITLFIPILYQFGNRMDNFQSRLVGLEEREKMEHSTMKSH